MNLELLAGRVLSLFSHAAGRPVARVVSPRMRYAQATPSFWTSASTLRLMAAPPKPPPAKTSPFARPRLALKYWAGMTERTIKQMLAHVRRATAQL